MITYKVKKGKGKLELVKTLHIKNPHAFRVGIESLEDKEEEIIIPFQPKKSKYLVNKKSKHRRKDKRKVVTKFDRKTIMASIKFEERILSLQKMVDKIKERAKKKENRTRFIRVLSNSTYKTDN